LGGPGFNRSSGQPDMVIPNAYYIEDIFKFMLFKEIDDKLWGKIRPLLPVWKPVIGRHRANLWKTYMGYSPI